MTNQRFTETLSTGIVTDNMTGKEYKCEMRIDDDLLRLLNELHEQVQALKSDRARYEEECRLDIFKELSEENEQLKKQLKPIQKVCEKYRIPIKDLPEILEEYIAYDNDDDW